MKNKILLVALVMVLVLALAGCGGVVTPDTEETKVKGVIQNYALAMNNQDWNKAKGYCIYQSYAYYMVEVIESLTDYYEVFTYKIDKIRDIEVEGNYGEANIRIVSTIGVWNEYIYLQKINGIWKIYTSYAYF